MALGDVDLDARLGEIGGVLNVANARAVAAIAEAIERDEWQGHGIASPEHWVKLRLGVSHSRAKVLVAVARRAADFPHTMVEFTAGGLSLEQVYEVVTRAPSWADVRMAGFAGGLTVPQLQRVLREEFFDGPADPPPATDQPTEPAPQPEAEAESEPAPEVVPGAGPDRFSYTIEGGRLTGWFDLAADRAPAVDALFTKIKEDLFRANGAPASGGEVFAETIARAAAASNHLDDGEIVSEHWGNGSRIGDVLGRTRTFLHLEIGDDPSRLIARFSNGAAIPQAITHYLTCDCTIRPVWTTDNVPVGYGRDQRVVPVSMRRLIEYRDGGCRVPGCGCKTVEIHHIIHWSDGGVTETWNLISLCPKHHRMHHLGQLVMVGNPDKPDGMRFYDITGREIHGPTFLKPDGALPTPTKPYEPPTGERMNLRWFSGWSKAAIDNAERLRKFREQQHGQRLAS